ncbi:MAG: glutamate--cysteine ligase [Alphaproteobacteria bacterium]|nr:MAG: glutamate--cysteine ligase [Alphaproteobacteria bacterium]
MAAPSKNDSILIEDKEQLVRYLESGNKPESDWRIGTEHEKFGFTLDTKEPLKYEGQQGIKRLLTGLQRFGWSPVNEGDNVIALQLDAAGITLEPAGQFELSGAPLKTVHETCDEVNTHLAQIREVSEEMGVGFIGLGFAPHWSRDDVFVMPKARYDIMRAYMPTKGSYGLDMMLRTCTVQVNLDYSSEADMVKKFRTSLALQPLATALFANSPFADSKPNGFLSYRSEMWKDTDPDRCGTLPFVFEDGMGFERYVDFALDVPMYFLYREGTYLDVTGLSFRDLMAGKLPGYEGELPSMTDWENHLTTIFPEVRLKRFLEMRGADGAPWKGICALSAFWVGLLYDSGALDAAWDLVKDWSLETYEQLRFDVPEHGLAAKLGDGTLQDLAKQVLKISGQGLRSRNRLDAVGSDETGFLTTLNAFAETGRTAAVQLLDDYQNKWDGSVMPVFDDYAY